MTNRFLCTEDNDGQWRNTPSPVIFPSSFSKLFLCKTLFCPGHERTKLKAGTSLNVTWSLGYPHKGGFYLEVLDPKDRSIRTLTPEQEGNKFITGDPT